MQSRDYGTVGAVCRAHTFGRPRDPRMQSATLTESFSTSTSEGVSHTEMTADGKTITTGKSRTITRGQHIVDEKGTDRRIRSTIPSPRAIQGRGTGGKKR